MVRTITLKKLLNNPWLILSYVLKKIAPIVPDKIQLSLLHKVYVGKLVNWKNPRTFTEKLQWLKIYNRKPEYTTMVDKYAVKDYVANIIGGEYIIPTIGVWDSPEDIDWDSLPQQFVLKTTHGGGSNGVWICKDKSVFDKQKCVKEMQCSLKSDLYRKFREWPYKDVPKRIIAEKFMVESLPQKAEKDLADYKFFCFGGEPKYCQVIRDRSTEETIDFYDMQWNHMPFVGLNPVAKNGLNPVAKPLHLDIMIEICRVLSKEIPFARVDLYVIDDKEYFGEITFFPASGMGVFQPDEWGTKLGDLIDLKGILSGGGEILIINNVISFKNFRFQTDLKDYKFFCFGGKVEVFKIDFNRQTSHQANYYNRDKVLLPYGEKVCPPDFNKQMDFPANFENMIELAEHLSQNLLFARVDFYNINGKIYFSEITFYPASGFGAFTSEDFNYMLGEKLKLPQGVLS